MMDTSEQQSIPPKSKRSREERDDTSSKVIKTSGESRGQVSQDIDMDIDEVEWTERKEILLEERMPVIRWTDGDKRKGIQVCNIQHTSGQYYLRETEVCNQDLALMDSVKRNGGSHVRIGNRRLWSNSRAIIGKMLEEKLRRRGRKSLGLKPETKSWGKIIHEATLVQLETREQLKNGSHRESQAG